MCGFKLSDWPSRPPTLPAIHPLCPRQGGCGLWCAHVSHCSPEFPPVDGLQCWHVAVEELSLGYVPLVTSEPYSGLQFTVGRLNPILPSQWSSFLQPCPAGVVLDHRGATNCQQRCLSFANRCGLVQVWCQPLQVKTKAESSKCPDLNLF